MIRTLRHNRHLLPVFVAAAIIGAWFVTNGTFDFFARTPIVNLEGVYDSMARHLLQGRVDLDFEAIQGEAFWYNGLIYSFYPPGPALFRMPLNAVAPSLAGRWAKLSMWIGYLLTAALVVALYREVARHCNVQRSNLAELIVALFALLGSTNLFLLSRAYFYHESAMWAGVASLATSFSVLTYWRTHRLSFLITAGLLAVFALFTRTSAGFGAVIVLLAGGLTPWLRSRFQSFRNGAIAAILITATAAGLLASYNQARFDNPFELAPFRYHAQYDAARLARTNGTLTNLHAIPQTLWTYWLRPRLAIDRRFPWFRFGNKDMVESERLRFDNVEATTGLDTTVPGILILAAVGIIVALKRFHHSQPELLILLTLAFAATGSIYIFAAVSQRYEHDIFPFLVLASSVGLCAIQQRAASRWLLLAIVFFVLYSAIVNISLTYINQMDGVWGIPIERKEQLRHWATKIDTVFLGSTTVGSDTECQVELRRTAAGFEQKACGSNQWRPLADTTSYALSVKLPINYREGVDEPLLTLGEPGQADIFIIHYDDHRFRLGLDHWGSPAVFSSSIEMSPRPVTVILILDRTAGKAFIVADSKVVLATPVRFYSWTGTAPTIGVAIPGATMQKKFTGELAAIPVPQAF